MLSVFRNNLIKAKVERRTAGLQKCTEISKINHQKLEIMNRNKMLFLTVLGLILNIVAVHSQPTKLVIEQDSISGMELKAVEGDVLKLYTTSLIP